MAEGRYSSAGPLRCCWSKRDGDVADGVNRMMVSVGKRYFKRAVKRNLLKRRIREAYRLQKNLLPAGGMDMMFIYRDKDVADFDSIFASVGTLLTNIGAKNNGTEQR